MDDYGSETKWLWILGIVILIVAVVGLVFAISAKNNSVNEDKVTEQINEELQAAGIAVESEKSASDRADRLAAADRRRIKLAVRSEKAQSEKRINNLAAETKKLNAQIAELKSEDTRLADENSDLSARQERTEAEVEKLEKRLSRALSG